MSIGSIPGDLVASIVLDTVTLAAEAGSIGVAVSSVVADGPSALRVTLTAPADLSGMMCIAEVDGDSAAPFLALAEPTGAPNEWRISWTPVAATAGISALAGVAPIATSVVGNTGTVELTPGTLAGDVLEWNGAAWVSATPPASVSSVGASSPVTSSGGTTPTIGLVAGTTTNDVLTWNGSAWVSAPAAAPSVPYVLTVDNATPTTVSYETRGAVYIHNPLKLAAGCAAYFYQGGSSNTGYMALTQAGGAAIFAEFVTTTHIGAPRYVAAALSAPYVGTTLAVGWYTIQVKYSSGGSSFLNGLGLYLAK